ncbi:MAG: adenylate/guanylate cyclase domain-containing protein [bacterium]
MKKFSPVVVVGFLLTILCAGLHVFEPEFIGIISLKSYDAFMRLSQQPPKSGRVVLVDLDEESLTRCGQWPWPRYDVARLTQKVLDGNASVVAFDIVFAEPDGKSLDVMRSYFNRTFNIDVKLDGIPDDAMNFDRYFASTLAKARKRTILGCFMYPATNVVDNVAEVDPNYRQYFFCKTRGGVTNVAEHLMQSGKMTISIPILSAAAGNNAFFNSWPDADNVVRRVPLFMAYGPSRTYPALAIEALRMDLGAGNIIIDCGDGDYGVEQLMLKNVVIPTDSKGQMLVNYRSPVGRGEGTSFRSFPSHPAWKVLEPGFDTSCFSNKIVFIGTSAPGLRDLRATPLLTSKSDEFAGVEVHATMVDNILSGDILRQPGWTTWVDLAAIILMGLFLTMLIQKGRAVLSFCVTIFVLGLALGVSYWLFKWAQFVYVPVRLIIAIIIIYPVLTMIRFWQEERQKKMVRDMFSTMVSSGVLHYLENNPESFSLTGKKVDATMFFSDIAGFTTISESLQPERLSDLLNRYLSPMTQIVMDRNGYVDKYEGDLIMAEWGVPFATEDHAVQGCLSAIEQQARLAELRPVLKQEFGHDVHVRIGLNTGTVTAGNMGSDRRFQYTVIGDAVNLARRLEPANKDYGTSIIIGGETAVKAAAVIEARMLDKIVVKGKSKPVMIYELVGKKGEVPEARVRIIRAYEDALRLYWDQKWSEAIAVLQRILGEDPADGPTLTLLKRSREFLVEPPGPDWSGAYLREDKE